MSERAELHTESVVSRIELAGPVSDRVQIQGVMLSNFGARRSADADTKDDAFTFEVDIPRFGLSQQIEKRNLFVFLEFKLKGQKGDTSEQNYSLEIDATFVISYTLDSFEGLGDENLRAFAQLNGVFNAWPYWREFVHSTTLRLGLHPVVIPVHRVTGGSD